VCHLTGRGSGIEIEVSTNAADAHLEHGDTLGPCPVAADGGAVPAAAVLPEAPSSDALVSVPAPTSPQNAEAPPGSETVPAATGWDGAPEGAGAGSEATSAGGFAAVVLEPDAATTTQVSIAIDPPRIRATDQELVAVAILTAGGFDATTVRAGSVCFGRSDDAARRDCTEVHGAGHLGDADGDGDLDLVLHYERAETGIGAGDGRACLAGETTRGARIEGCGPVTAP
jgi:hypothetical protein